MKAPAKSKSASVKSAAKKAEHVHGPNCNHDHGHGDDNLSCEVAIRVYQPGDFKELTNVWKAGKISLDDTDTAKAIETNLKKFKDRFQVFVAEAAIVDQRTRKLVDKPHIAGGVVLASDSRRAYIYHLAVHPEFRNVGLGRALLETCEAQARIWGIKHLRLTARTDPSRVPAHEMYQRTGWKSEQGLIVYGKTI